jgi:hypothetical protein
MSLTDAVRTAGGSGTVALDRMLVVVRAVDDDRLVRFVLGQDAATAVHLVVPARRLRGEQALLHSEHLGDGDADGAFVVARVRLGRILQLLEDHGRIVTGSVGAANLARAVRETCAGREFDRVLVFDRPRRRAATLERLNARLQRMALVAPTPRPVAH